MHYNKSKNYVTALNPYSSANRGPPRMGSIYRFLKEKYNTQNEKEMETKILRFILAVAFIVKAFTCTGQFFRETYIDDSEKNKYKNGICEISFVGNGDIQFGYDVSKDGRRQIEANTGLGVLFWRIWKEGQELQLDAKINVASTADTIFSLRDNGNIVNQRLFGRYALIPSGTGQSTVINSLWYLRRTPGKYDSLKLKTDSVAWWKRPYKLIGTQVDGFEFSGSSSSQVWASYTKNAASPTRANVNSTHVACLSFRAGVFHEFLPQELRRQTGFSIRLGINGIIKSIGGDIGLGSETARNNRVAFLGGYQRNYFGHEALLSLRLRNIRAEASLPYIYRGRRSNGIDGSVPGLTGTQFYTSISFVGGFPLRIAEATKQN